MSLWAPRVVVVVAPCVVRAPLRRFVVLLPSRRRGAQAGPPIPPSNLTTAGPHPSERGGAPRVLDHRGWRGGDSRGGMKGG